MCFFSDEMALLHVPASA